MISPVTLRAFSSELTKIAKKQSDPKLTEKDIKKIERDLELWNKLREVSPVDVGIDDEAHIHGGGFFDSKEKRIGLSEKNPHSLAHEMGHAELDKNFLGRAVQHPVGRAVFPWTPVAGALGGVLLSKGKKMGVLLPIMTAAPTLLSESLATRKGAKKLKEVGATEEEIDQYKKELKDSFGTYSSIGPEAVMAGGLGYLASSR